MRTALPSVRPSPDGDSHLASAADLLNRDDFFSPRVEAAEVVLTHGDKFHFTSLAPSGCSENDQVPGRFFPTSGEWRNRPAMILLHGWNSELQYEWMIPFWGQLLARAGVNAFAFQLPYHGARKPQSCDVIRNFFSGDLAHVMRATHQTLADVRALAGWLGASGAPSVGVWGVSLGGWLAGMAIAHQPELNRAVLVTPVVRMDRAFRELPFCEVMRAGADALAPSTFANLNTVSHRPACDPRNVLIVSGKHDLFAPAETIAELAQTWRCESWCFNHGHITILLSTRIMRRIVKWVAATEQAGPRPAD
jgi:dienelactone hydrolase